jgi:hypothetical protein
MVQAAKLQVVIPEDHRLQIELPADLPAGPAEVIVLVTREQPAVVDRRAAMGMDRGAVWVAEDFDGPLPEFVRNRPEAGTRRP